MHLHLFLPGHTSCCECMGHWCMLGHLKSLHGREHPEKLTFTLHMVSPFGEPWGAFPWGWLRVVRHCGSAKLWDPCCWRYIVKTQQDNAVSSLVWICSWPRSQQETTLDASRSPFQPLSLSRYPFLSPFLLLSIFFSVSFFSMEIKPGFFPLDAEKLINGQNRHLLKSTVKGVD